MKSGAQRSSPMYQRLTDHLVRQGVIAAATAHGVTAIHRNEGGHFLELLLKHSDINDVGLARAIGEVFQRRVIDVSRVTIEPDAVGRVSGSFCRRNQVLPFAVREARVRVATWDPVRARPALRLLQDASTQLEVYIAPRHALSQAIERAYPEAGEADALSKLPLFEDPQDRRHRQVSLDLEDAPETPRHHRSSSDLGVSRESGREHQKKNETTHPRARRDRDEARGGGFDGGKRKSTDVFSGALDRDLGPNPDPTASLADAELSIDAMRSKPTVKSLQLQIYALREENMELRERIERLEAAIQGRSLR